MIAAIEAVWALREGPPEHVLGYLFRLAPWARDKGVCDFSASRQGHGTSDRPDLLIPSALVSQVGPETPQCQPKGLPTTCS